MKIIWTCSKCGTEQDRDKVETREITEPGHESRIEYYGKIRPTFFRDGELEWMEYECLVCGYVYSELDDMDDPDDDPDPGEAFITLLRPTPVPEEECCDGCVFCIDRDAC